MVDNLFTQDLRRNSVTWKLFDVAAFADRANPTAAELNTTDTRLGFDITCALDEESTTFTIGSSELDERLSFCDSVGVSRPGQINPEIALGLYRDEDRNASGVFNLALDWLRHVDQEYIMVQRVGDQDSGPLNGTPAKEFTVDDDIRMMAFRTDYPVDTLASGDPALLAQNGLTAGFVRWNEKPVA
ncbi:major tail protein [Microbacterium phage vB_MoxS-ISF9]|uniref:Major tail protein n=1 Tax=Microbacterium phage vB_MoxS-ISF9 TaxID=1458670 RepID=W8P072_9CAUD|nr:major tail protein [Microbacterium phage vB_MoxS-ISF9]AHL18487.1 hypothetical protein ISF9_017 [Microbacterium phage vB_MoxS-ISF9]